MKIVYLGSGQFGIDCLNALYESRHSIEFIVTQPARPAGRGKKSTPTPVANWAREHSIDFVETDNINTSEMTAQISRFEPELIVVIAFGQKIGNDMINTATHKAINIHSSLLPKYRGAAPINRAVIDGEKETGISIITLAEKMDAGDILGQAKIQIKENETAGELHNRLAKLSAGLLLTTIDRIENGTAVHQKQDHSKATLAPKLKKTDGYLDLSESAKELSRKILGLTPWPGASCFYFSRKSGKAERVVIMEAEIINCREPAKFGPGTLDENLNVICGEDALKIIRIKPAGKNPMAFKDFVNGRSSQPGDRFVKIED
ncbi:MAG: methionyl-tRNA formyltransferase [Planctomycetota bacterium]|jgi:methionyl-tRNA formyltransferase